MNNSLLETMVAIEKLQQKIDDGISDVDRKRALETMSNLIHHVNPAELAKLVIVHHRITTRLRKILQNWNINKKVIQQGIEQARQFGDTAEEDRLTGRLAGVILLYDEVKDALNLRRQFIDDKRCKNAKTDL